MAKMSIIGVECARMPILYGNKRILIEAPKYAAQRVGFNPTGSRSGRVQVGFRVGFRGLTKNPT